MTHNEHYTKQKTKTKNKNKKDKITHAPNFIIYTLLCMFHLLFDRRIFHINLYFLRYSHILLYIFRYLDSYDIIIINSAL